MEISVIEANAVRASDVIHSVAVWMQRTTVEERKLFLLLMSGVMERERLNG